MSRTSMTLTGPGLRDLTLDRAALHRLQKAAARGLHGSHRALVEVGHREIARAVSAFLQVDVTELMTAVWSQSDAILTEARQSRREPALRTPVHLDDHTYPMVREGTVRVSVDNLPPLELPLRLEVDLGLHGVTAVLADGGIAEIACGTGHLELRCFLQDVELARWPYDVDLTVTVRLDPPIVLVPAAPAPRTEQADGS